ncbi:MAG: hypothetical protein MJ192_01485 [Clostridia bacterium]|nr:hypothetical protein [Clostridia bacterium]
MTFTTLSMVILLVTAGGMVVGGLRGYRKGAPVSLLRLAVILAAAVIAALSAPVLTRLTLGGLADTILDNLDLTGPFTGYPGYAGLCRSFLSGLLSPAVGLVLFLLLWLVGGLIISASERQEKHAPGQRSQGKSAERIIGSEQNPDRAVGAAVGAAAAFVICVIVFSPVTGSLKTVDTMMTVLNRTEGIHLGKLNESNRQSLAVYAQDPSAEVLYACGGRLIYRTSARTRIDNKTCLPVDELVSAEPILRGLRENLPLLTNPANPDPAGTAGTLQALISEAERSPCTMHILPDYVRAEAPVWLAAYTESAQASDSVESPIIQAMLGRLSLVGNETVCSDLDVVMSVFEEFGTLRGIPQEKILNRMTEESFLEAVNAELQRSENLAPCAESLNDTVRIAFGAVMRAKCGSMPNEYSTFIADLTDTVNGTASYSGDRRLTTISDCLYDYTGIMGINASDDMLTVMSQAIAMQFDDRSDNVNADEVAQVFGIRPESWHAGDGTE